MSQDLYRAITDFAHGTPAWVHTFTEIGTDAGLFIFLALCIVAWWRARPAGARTMAIAALAPVATAFGYVVSETLKTFVQEERPCRAVVGAAASIAECPEYGDWSFPSNHSAIAGAFAMALVLAWRRTTWFVVPLAVLMAFSRVFVGVHYPHDVVAGLIVGALAVVLFVRLLTGPTVKLVETMRTSGSGAANWLAGSGEAPSGTAAVAAGASAGRRAARLAPAAAGGPRSGRRAPGAARQEVPERQEYPQYGDIGGSRTRSTRRAGGSSSTRGTRRPRGSSSTCRTRRPRGSSSTLSTRERRRSSPPRTRDPKGGSSTPVPAVPGQSHPAATPAVPWKPGRATASSVLSVPHTPASPASSRMLRMLCRPAHPACSACSVGPAHPACSAAAGPRTADGGHGQPPRPGRPGDRAPGATGGVAPRIAPAHGTRGFAPTHGRRAVRAVRAAPAGAEREARGRRRGIRGGARVRIGRP